MKEQLTVVLLVIASFVIAQAPSAERNRNQKELSHLLYAYADALRSRNVTVFSRILSDDYTEISVSGEIESKAEVLDRYKSRQFPPNSGGSQAVKVDEITIRDYGNTAVITARLTFSSDANVKSPGSRLRGTFLCVNERPQWRIAAAQMGSIKPPQLERVHGIGGFFFRSSNPRTLAQWYANHFGVDTTPTDYVKLPWHQAAGPTIFEPFPPDTTYFGRPSQTWMINFRVRKLDVIVAQLRASGIEVEVDPRRYPNGRFARLNDPEGNPIELWEPQGRDALP